MRAIRCVLAGLMAAAIVTAVAAQPGGFGGFGGGDVNTLVLTNAALQEDLKVTAAQKEKFKAVADKQTEIQKTMGEMFSKGKDGFDKDKFTELREKMTKVGEEGKKVVEDTLTADQKKRLKQISIQVMQFSVFNDPEAKAEKGKGKGFGGFPLSEAQKAVVKEVGEALKLSDKQKSTVKGVVDEFNKEQREVMQEAFGGGFDQEKMAAANKKVDRLRKDAWEKIEDALNSDQKAAWKGLVGERFDTAKLRPTLPKKD